MAGTIRAVTLARELRCPFLPINFGRVQNHGFRISRSQSGRPWFLHDAKMETQCDQRIVIKNLRHTAGIQDKSCFHAKWDSPRCSVGFHCVTRMGGFVLYRCRGLFVWRRVPDKHLLGGICHGICHSAAARTPRSLVPPLINTEPSRCWKDVP